MAAKDANGYPLSTWVKNSLEMGSGMSLYPWVRARVAFDIHVYLQNSYEKVVFISDI
jgi:hypothetical protein